jgi:hypothetical protein
MVILIFFLFSCKDKKDVIDKIDIDKSSYMIRGYCNNNIDDILKNFGFENGIIRYTIDYIVNGFNFSDEKKSELIEFLYNNNFIENGSINKNKFFLFIEKIKKLIPENTKVNNILEKYIESKFGIKLDPKKNFPGRENIPEYEKNNCYSAIIEHILKKNEEFIILEKKSKDLAEKVQS